MENKNFDEVCLEIDSSSMAIYELENALGIDQANPNSIMSILQCLLEQVENKIDELTNSENIVNLDSGIEKIEQEEKNLNFEDAIAKLQDFFTKREELLNSMLNTKKLYDLEIENKNIELDIKNIELEKLNVKFKNCNDKIFVIYAYSILKRKISLHSKKLAIINRYNELNKESMELATLPLSIEFDIEAFSKRQCDFNHSSNFIRTKKK